MDPSGRRTRRINEVDDDDECWLPSATGGAANNNNNKHRKVIQKNRLLNGIRINKISDLDDWVRRRCCSRRCWLFDIVERALLAIVILIVLMVLGRYPDGARTKMEEA
jgi:hypothetical protein